MVKGRLWGESKSWFNLCEIQNATGMYPQRTESIGVQSNLRFDWGLGKNSSSSTKPQSHKVPLRSFKDSAPRRSTLTVSPECAEVRHRSPPAYRFFTGLQASASRESDSLAVVLCGRSEVTNHPNRICAGRCCLTSTRVFQVRETRDRSR